MDNESNAKENYEQINNHWAATVRLPSASKTREQKYP